MAETKNPMQKIKIEKVTLNIGCGGDADEIERSKKLLKMLTANIDKERTPVVTLSKRRSTFGIAKDKPVGVKVTLRGKAAEDMLRLALTGVENRLKAQQFNSPGNFSFGIREYIDMANVKYNHEVGMLGLEVTATLEKAGFRVKRRKIKTGKVGRKQEITSAEAMRWLAEKFGVNISE